MHFELAMGHSCGPKAQSEIVGSNMEPQTLKIVETPPNPRAPTPPPPTPPPPPPGAGVGGGGDGGGDGAWEVGEVADVARLA